MLTNNWYTYFKTWYGCASNSNTGLGTPDAIDSKGQARVPVCQSLSGSTTMFASYAKNALKLNPATMTVTDKNAGVFFGNGTSAPTKGDHTLSGDLITTFNVVNTTESHSCDGDTVTHTMTYFLENTGSAPITISEVAWFGYGRTTGSGAGMFLFDRTLLDAPITIAPGGIGKVVYNRSVSYPTA